MFNKTNTTNHPQTLDNVHLLFCRYIYTQQNNKTNEIIKEEGK